MSKLKLSVQEGRALILVLIILGLGALLIPVFLSHASTNLFASRATEEGMREQYASDAGVEYAAWKLDNDPVFRAYLFYSNQITLTTPTLVNGIEPTVLLSMVAGAPPLGNFGSQIALGRGLNDVRFYNDDVGFAVGDKETVLKTYDGGWTWGQQRGVIGTGDPNFNSVFPVSPFDIWIVGTKSGSDSPIMHNDGGDTWEFVDCPTGQELNSVFFVDADHGWAVGQKGGGKSTIVYYDGNTWALQSVQSDPKEDLNGVCFVDDNGVYKGWAVGEDGTILRTTDGGNTWQEASDSGTEEDLYAVFFVDGNIGWAVGDEVGDDGTIVRSINGGVDWITQTVPSGVGDLRDVSFLIDGDGDWTNDVGWAVGSGQRIIKTTDGGSSWFSESSDSKTLQGVHVNSATHGCAVGEQGIILIYDGSSWVVQNEFLVNDLQSVWMADETHAWLAGEGGVIAKTTDGMRWFPKGDLTEDLFGISFAGSYTPTTPGWAVGANGNIFKSSDAGETWNLQARPVDVQLNDVYAISADKVVAVGNSGTVIATTNGGGSWGSMEITTENLNAVFFAPGTETGWAVGDKKGNDFTIYKTTDAGDNWTPQSSAENAADLYGVSCINEQIAWAVGKNGIVLKTTDGGTAWVDPRGDTGWPSKDLYSVFFDTTVDAGWAVGKSSGLLGWPPEEGSESGAYESADGGESWEGLLTGTTTDIQDIFVIDPCHGWAVGESGTLLQFLCPPGKYVGDWYMLVDIYSTADDTLTVSRVEACTEGVYIYSWDIE